MSQQLAERTVSFLTTKFSRRGFLVRLAVAGSALSVSPLRYILRPGTAYATVCGPDASCSSGYTAMCCTVSGVNRCPPGTFAAGWWRADNSGFCCGNGPRYYIDCNMSCGVGCGCHCAGGSCDQRKVCCNRFRYGQCHQEIRCYGPIKCRVVVCTPPWILDPSCGTSLLIDNRTAHHWAPCLPGQCDVTAIDRHWYDLGGDRSFLASPTTPELTPPDGAGRFRHYEGGSIYWTPHTRAWEVHGAIREKWAQLGWERGFLGYPLTDELPTPDRVGRFNHFQGGSVYWTPQTWAHEVHGAIREKWAQLGWEQGFLRYPLTDELTTPDGVGRFNHFQGGSVYWTPQTRAHEVHGPIRQKWAQLGWERSSLGYPVTDVYAVASGQRCDFQGGAITWNQQTNTFRVTDEQ